jgi:hypothetical protein
MQLNAEKNARGLLLGMILLTVASPALASSWTEKIKWQGDFRYRYEVIDEEGEEQRNRQRIRARIGLFADVMNDVRIGFQITSGSDDPVSNNQTLGDGFSTKPLGIDFAYFEWKPSVAKGLKVQGGKFKNPWYKSGKSELVWDSDWNPEGLFVYYKVENLATFDLFVDGGVLWVEERSAAEDAMLVGGQGGLIFSLLDGSADVIVGGSYFTYLNTKGYEPFVDADDGFGNTLEVVLDGGGNPVGYVYPYDFEIMEFFLEFGGEIRNLPVTFMADYVNNSGADDDNYGYLFGLRFGKARGFGTVGGRYIYREVEANAVLGAFTDSDFIGGGTDGSGHEAGIDVGLAEKITFSTTYFMNRKGLDDGVDFNRLQVDVKFKF